MTLLKKRHVGFENEVVKPLLNLAALVDNGSPRYLLRMQRTVLDRGHLQGTTKQGGRPSEDRNAKRNF
ncbi:hypothetical protein GGR93_001992 [Sulfitobacter noctilucicola]|uniref:Uncharacterized protein n=1 Tax=Sulfitobacter noctilucicola TaxID=1342301 RepID=A0A7W6Q4H9_9RHOB|nr:hypothetical protein [Sulfitobacter noctilucicola]